jgi:homoserine acetyltransferase
LKKALKFIKAKTLLISSEWDLLVPVDAAKEAHKYIPKSKLALIPSYQGHFAATAKDPKDVAFMNKTISDFLQDKSSQESSCKNKKIK